MDLRIMRSGTWLGLGLTAVSTPALAAGWLEESPLWYQAVVPGMFFLIFAIGSTATGYALARVRPGLLVAGLGMLLGAPLVFVAATETPERLDKFSPIYAVVVLLFLGLFNLGRHFGSRDLRRRSPA
jgi:peptidoglycan/LPS O-acetylase OafA/YrhL